MGTPQQVVAKNGAKTWEGVYRAFGGVKSETGSWEQRLRFPGQYFDQETGNFYNYHRDLDPSTGRYLESDPTGLAGGLNTYGYGGGDPVNKTDPTGLAFYYGNCKPDGANKKACENKCSCRGEEVAVCKEVCWGLVGEACLSYCKCGSKTEPYPTPDRKKACQDAFLSCLNDRSIPESTCFAAHETCIRTTGPMIFPGHGLVK